jgi:hypothetical protein
LIKRKNIDLYQDELRADWPLTQQDETLISGVN